MDRREGHRGAGYLSWMGLKGPKPAGEEPCASSMTALRLGPDQGGPHTPTCPPPGTQHAISSGLRVSPCGRELHQVGTLSVPFSHVIPAQCVAHTLEMPHLLVKCAFVVRRKDRAAEWR